MLTTQAALPMKLWGHRWKHIIPVEDAPLLNVVVKVSAILMKVVRCAIMFASYPILMNKICDIVTSILN